MRIIDSAVDAETAQREQWDEGNNVLAIGRIAIKIARFPPDFAVHKRGKKENDAHSRFDIRSSRRGMR